MASNSNNPYETLTNDLDRIKKRQKFTKKLINDKVDQVISFLEETNTKISQINPTDKKTEYKEIKNEFQNLHHNLSVKLLLSIWFSKFQKNCKPLQNILSQHKEYYAYISKLGKNIDKNFNQDINEAFEPVELDDDSIKALISEHLIREGKFELEEIFNEEAGIIATTEFRNAFQRLHQILISIKNRDLGPAIEWVQTREEFKQNDCKLLFGMHKLQFASILVKEGRAAAIAYARGNFPQFARFYQNEIQKLMASILFKDTLLDSPYSEFYNEKNWSYLEELIIQETCKVIKKSPECSLFAATTAGTLALPKFLKFSSVSSNKMDWKDKSEIPIEVEIGKDFKYHSIFICPVSKEISNPENPPMLLKCGHVIAQHSLKKMSNNNNKTKFKCPTCPTEQTAQQVHEIHF